MSRRVIVRPEAEVDIQAAHDYLQQISAGLGELFSTRLRDVFERIESAPGTFGRYGCGGFIRCVLCRVLGQSGSVGDPARGAARVGVAITG
jgi:hypothetical protein